MTELYEYPDCPWIGEGPCPYCKEAKQDAVAWWWALTFCAENKSYWAGFKDETSWESSGLLGGMRFHYDAKEFLLAERFYREDRRSLNYRSAGKYV